MNNWKQIEALNWNTTKHLSSQEKERIAMLALKGMSKEETRSLRDFASDRHLELYKRWDQHKERNPHAYEVGSDDGHSDLLYDIIGSGEAVFNEAIADTKAIEKKASAGDYTECFAYILPNEMDRKKLSRDHFKSNAKELLAEIRNAIQATTQDHTLELLKRLDELLSRITKASFEAITPEEATRASVATHLLISNPDTRPLLKQGYYHHSNLISDYATFGDLAE